MRMSIGEKMIWAVAFVERVKEATRPGDVIDAAVYAATMVNALGNVPDTGNDHVDTYVDDMLGREELQ